MEKFSTASQSGCLRARRSLAPVTYSLHRPPAGMTGFLRLIWPLIFVQLIALKAWVRKHYGPGVPYWYEISRWGRVRLMHMPIDFAQSYAAPGALKPAAFDFTLASTSPRFACALAAETNAPVPAPERQPKTYSVHVHSIVLLPDTS
ncbi:MAG: hypothetical protein Q8S09_11580 [Hyphomonas sp.]|nr:hypothetical protein [Hyphomonas sp.]